MRPLQSVQRRTGFETLEAKKLFAADLMGSAAIDLPDTTIVAGFEHSDVAETIDGMSAENTLVLLTTDLNRTPRKLSGPGGTDDSDGDAVDIKASIKNQAMRDIGRCTLRSGNDSSTAQPNEEKLLIKRLELCEAQSDTSIECAKSTLERAREQFKFALRFVNDDPGPISINVLANDSIGADRVDHNSARSNGGIVGEGGGQR